MNRMLYPLLFALTFATTIAPLTVSSTLLENKKTGKRVLLLSEWHASWVEPLLTEKQLANYTTVEKKQKKDFAKLAHELLALDTKKGAQTIVINETGRNVLGYQFEQELGRIDTREQLDETMHVMSRLFIRTILAPAETVDAKTALFKASVKPFNDTPAASFVFDNQMRWIVGDTLRTERDGFLIFDVYNDWKGILASIENKEELPAALAELSIANVKKYVRSLHETYVDNDIDDPYFDAIVASIDAAVKAGKLKGSDHFAALYKYLQNNDQESEINSLYNDILRFISLKTDFELRTYVQEFEKDPALHYAIINFGDAHIEYVEDMLLDGGYGITAHNGYEHDIEVNTKDDVKKEILQIVGMLKKQPSLVQIDTLFKDTKLA